MVSQNVYSVVIFSHRFLDSDCINFKTFAFLAVYWPFWTSLYNTDIKVQKKNFNRSSTMLNNVFNIVEAPLKKIELWCLCCMMMFRWTNKQPGMQNIRHLYSHYQADWISPLNKRSGLPFILTQQSMWRIESDKSGHLSICTSLKHLIGALKCIFQASFLHLIKDTDSM